MEKSDPFKIVYISDRIVPNGNAGGVRVDHITKMLMMLQSDLHIISYGEKNFRYFNDGRTFHEIKRQDNTLGKFSSKIFSGLRALKLYSKISSGTDIIVLYSTNIFFVCPILVFAKFYRIKIFFDVVENFHHEKFSLGYLSPKFWMFRLLMRHIITKGNGVFAISKSIAKYFEKQRVKSYLLPPLFSFDNQKFLKPLPYNINMIYSGSPLGKEDLSLMFQAILQLNSNERSRLKLNFTGVKKNEIMRYCEINDINFDNVKDNLYFYPWLTQSELHSVYVGSHFQFFLRKNNPSNVSNYPMKLIEMLSFGIVPILSDVGDYGELFRKVEYELVVAHDNLPKAKDALQFALALTEPDYNLLQKRVYDLGKKFDTRTFAHNNRENIMKFIST